MRDAAERLSPMQPAMACRTTFKSDLIGASLGVSVHRSLVMGDPDNQL